MNSIENNKKYVKLVQPKIGNSYHAIKNLKSRQSSLILQIKQSNSKTNLSELGLQKHLNRTYCKKDLSET